MPIDLSHRFWRTLKDSERSLGYTFCWTFFSFTVWKTSIAIAFINEFYLLSQVVTFKIRALTSVKYINKVIHHVCKGDIRYSSLTSVTHKYCVTNNLNNLRFFTVLLIPLFFNLWTKCQQFIFPFTKFVIVSSLIFVILCNKFFELRRNNTEEVFINLFFRCVDNRINSWHDSEITINFW